MTIRSAGIRLVETAIHNNPDPTMDATCIVDALIAAGWLGPCDFDGCVAVGPHRYHLVPPV